MDEYQVEEGMDRPSPPLRRRSLKGKDERTSKGSASSSLLRRLWRRYQLTKISLIVCGLFLLVGGGYLFFLAKTARVEDLQEALKATTILYDKDDQEAGTLSGQKGTYVELDAIADYLEQAVIATEDRSFYSHSGINYKRTALALLTLGKSGGGSTITQQLAKNAFLTQEQTISRKAREFFLAIELTKQFSKDAILTMYLNNAYFGNGVWGVEDASQKYFGRSASELSLDQAALLAGLLKGPELYNPYASLDRARDRRATVLQSMVDAGYVDQGAADAAAQVDLASQIVDRYEGRQANYAYPSYFDAVIAEAVDRYGLKETDLVTNGYRIYTEMDQVSQAHLQVIYEDVSLFPHAPADGSHAQAASVALEPQTGGVRALVGRVGSASHPGFRVFNFASQSKRSPGSTIKPLVAYAPAVAAGWEITTPLDNQRETYGDYTLHNYDFSTSETVPMYQALALSYNLPVAAIVHTLGVDTAVAYGEKFGLDVDQADRVLGLAIGSGVTTNPLQMAQAYATFANRGRMPKAHLIRRIESASGRVLAEHKEGSRPILDATVADQMTAMMLGTYSHGTGQSADSQTYYLAGKTGTTETSFDASLINDQWHIAYTPDLVISQWVGFEQTDEQHYIDSDTSWMAPVVFRTVVDSLLPQTAGTAFQVTNAYAQDGQVVERKEDPQKASDSLLSLEGIGQKAQTLIDQTRETLQEAQLPQRAQTLWDSLTSWFGELSNP